MQSAVSSRSLRIVLLGTRGIPARYGGFETFAEQLSRRLAERGHTVTVYGRCRITERWGARETIDGVHRRVTPTVFHKYLETPLHALTSFVDLLPQSYDIALLCNAANTPFAFLLKLRRAPLLVNVDGIERNRGKWNAFGKAWYRLGEWCSMLLATRVISDAEVIAEYYRETYSCKSVVIPYGVHPVVRPPDKTLQEFGLTTKNYLLYVSRLEPENNALGVIQAYVQLNTGMPLVIVGDAPYAEEYKQSLRAAADSRVVFTGYQFGSAYEELQSNCYLYIQATEVGGTHPALVESMSYGNCVVVNGTPENLEVIKNAGRSFSKNDFLELSSILSELLSDPDQVRRLGGLAYERSHHQYSWDSVVERYEALFAEVVPNEQPRQGVGVGA
jgi:glycosyltransferase involved in cell wall biosynthesis